MAARRIIVVFLLLGAVVWPRDAGGQDRRSEQFYYPGGFNWRFLKTYPEAARLFNAFDYGHAVLYERLYTARDSASLARALEREYRYLTTDLLVRPPRFAVAEEVIEPAYAKLAWRAKLMFEWAHVLHRQIYDVYADERIPEAEKDSLIERLTDYYLSREDIAFTPVPKSMALMDEQYYSQVFRRRFPKFNGLIWAYHWLQVGLYEPLIAGRTPNEKKAGVQAMLAQFWDMLNDAPQRMPQVMPMTATVVPLFTTAHARAAAIFDNLHMMHDIISDILLADTVPHEQKRAVIYAALDEFRDTTRNVMTREEWLMMGHHMGGIEVMGGPALGILRPTGDSAAEPMRKPLRHPEAPDEAGAPAAQAPVADSAKVRAAAAALVRALVADTARLRALVADSAAAQALDDVIALLPEPDRANALAAVRAVRPPSPAPAHPHRRHGSATGSQAPPRGRGNELGALGLLRAPHPVVNVINTP